jgi:short-subunit dehydrogenase involved in D-alanine esterification of teichoic acids
MEHYFINGEEVTKETFQESMTESCEDLNDYEKDLIENQLQNHCNINILVNDFTYRIECE